MKKLLLLSLLTVGALTANADTVVVSFDNFKQGTDLNLPEGWSTQGSMSFSNSDSGLRIIQQGYYGNGYLITPELEGTISFEYNIDEADYDPYYGEWEDSGEIHVYEASPDGNTFTTSTRLWYDNNGTGTWKTKTIDLTEPTHLAFNIDYGAIRNFTYEDGDVVTPDYRFTMSNMNYSSDYSRGFAADASGNVPVSFTLSVKNTGAQALTPTAQGVNFALSNPTAGDLGTVTWTGGAASIAPGETETITVTGTFPISLFEAADLTVNDNGYYRQRFNITAEYSTSLPYVWHDVYPWAFKYRLSKSGTTANVTSIDFGFVNSMNNSVQYVLTNMGARPMNITAVSSPLGFSTDLTAPTTIANTFATDDLRTKTITFTAESTSGGIFSGNYEFAVEGMEEPVRIAASAVIPGGDLYYADFEDGEYPAGWIIDSDLTVTTDTDTSVMGVGNTHLLQNGASSRVMRAISPMLHFNEGEKLAFQAGGMHYSSSYPDVTVYVSTNRAEWTKVKQIRCSSYASEGVDAFPGKGDAYTSKLGTYLLDMNEGDYYVAFDIYYARIDNVFGGELVDVPYDLMFTDVAVGTRAMVNNAYTPAITVKNLGTQEIEANSYEVSLIIDGETVNVITETEAIPVSGEVSYAQSYTFHNVGDHTVLVELRAGDYVLATNVATVNVIAEASTGMAPVGEGTMIQANSNNYPAPMYFYYKKSLSFVTYPQEVLAQYGIMPGMDISAISLTGYLQTPKSGLNGPIEVWMFPTEYSTLAPANSTELTEQLTDDNLVYSIANWENNYPSEESEMFKFDFTTPYHYEGGNLMLAVHKDFVDYSNVFFFLGDTAQSAKDRAIIKYADNDSSYETASYSNPKALSQVNFYYNLEPATYSGTVVNANDNAPVADALITLTSGDVIYNGTSAEDGTFSINVFQDDKDYDVLVSASNYNDYTSTASFADGNVETTIELTPEVGDGVGSVNADKVNVRIEGDMIFVDGVDAAVLSIFNAAGQMMTRAEATAISIANLNAGVYVLNVKSANGTASVKFVKR